MLLTCCITFSLFLGAYASVTQEIPRASDCFPFNFPSLFEAVRSSRARSDWWCDSSQQYGFMGFSYPLENDDCTAYSNTLESISADFSRMKSDYGATMVRIYAPECRDISIWRNILQAGIDNNMAVIPLIWWGFEDQNLWKKSRSALLALLKDPNLGPFAPYIFHSVAFGSEPIGDGVDGSRFLTDLSAFKKALQPYGIPVTISEDWDRPGTMSSQDSTGLGPVGQKVANMVDLLHIHLMPYYHADRFPTSSDSWPYFVTYIQFLKKTMPNKQILISQTLWSSEIGSHERGWGNPGINLGNFTDYWKTISSQCKFFKTNQVGWFMHAWDDTFELGLGLLDTDGAPKMYFAPGRC